MLHLFDLPIEILTLTLGHLELADLFRFCATCQSMRRAFRPDHLVWIVENYNHPCSTLAHSLALMKVIENSSYLLLCHTFLKLFRTFGVHKDYDILLQRGASFRPIPHGRVLEEYLDIFGAGEEVEFLLKHGSSFGAVPGGVNRLLEDALRCQSKERAAFLIRHGASMRELPSGPEQLLEDLFRDFQRDVPWLHVLSILGDSRPLVRIPKGLEHWLGGHFAPDKMDDLLPYLPDGLNVMLKVALCKYGLGPEVDELLLHGASFYEIPPAGDVQYDASGIVRAIQTGDFDALNIRGETPLIRAVILGHVDAVVFLLNSGADYEVEWKKGTPLSYAVMRDRLEVARLLLERGASINGKTTTYEYAQEESPLLCDTARRGQWEMALLLLMHAADPDVLTSAGSTALHLAAERDLWEIVRILLEHGACSRIADGEGFYPLTLAAARGRLGSVKALATDYEVNIRDEGGRTALSAASGRGHLDIVRLLLDRGADPALADGEGRTSLFAAASNGHFGITKLLIKRGIDINAAFRGQSPLYAAARRGYLSIVQSLLQEGADLAAANNDGLTPLGAAVEGLHLAVVRVLIKARSDLEVRDTNGRTPLLIAASVDFLSGYRLLIHSGADPNATTSEGDTALHIAVREGYIATGMVICKDVAVNRPNQDGQTPIHLAARNGSLDLVRTFIKCGLSPDPAAEDETSLVTSAVRRRKSKTARSALPAVHARDDRGRTPLFAAAEKGHIHVVHYLVGEGAEVNATDLTGRTPLHVAALHGNTEIAVLLIDLGARQVRSHEGTPLHLAANAGHIGVADLLFERGADVNATTDAGDTPLHLSIQHPEMVERLLRWGAAVDFVNERNQTPLVNAVQLGNPKTMQSLAEAGANPSRKVDGTTPFLAAVHSGWLEAVCAMHQHGADVNARDSAGLTPLHHAASQGWLEVASFLVREGADQHAQDRDGQLPWESALKNGHVEVALIAMPEAQPPPPQDGLQEGTRSPNIACGDSFQMAEHLIATGIDPAVTDGYAPRVIDMVDPWICDGPPLGVFDHTVMSSTVEGLLGIKVDSNNF